VYIYIFTGFNHQWYGNIVDRWWLMGDLGIILLVGRGLLYLNIIQYCWIGIFHGSNIPQTQPWFSIRSIHLGDNWSVSALPQLVDDWFGDVRGLYYLPYKGLPIAQNSPFLSWCLSQLIYACMPWITYFMQCWTFPVRIKQVLYRAVQTECGSNNLNSCWKHEQGKVYSII